LGDSDFHRQTGGEKASALALADLHWKPNVMMPFDNMLTASDDNVGENGGDDALMKGSINSTDIEAEQANKTTSITASTTAATAAHRRVSAPTTDNSVSTSDYNDDDYETLIRGQKGTELRGRL
jgi:hypothetical protein